MLFRESFGVEEEGDEVGREISGRRWAEEEGTEARDAQQPVVQCELEKGPRAS